ncbi:MAG: thiamine pyrophosphate-binding protein [Myxococcota bacterium]|nr:thiamine pyrophosphate-binding protein [Myxococcota bacterium]
MAELNGGQLVARQLELAGIDTLFGVVAGPMIEVFSGSIERGLNVIGCRHEENAAFMASAWGYANKKPGVIVTGSGPGMTNTVTPMHVATESAMPLVVLGGSVHGMMRGIGGFQECDQLAFARPGCKWVQQVDSVERIPELLHLALGKAVSGRPGAVYLDFPGHLVSATVPENEARFRTRQPEFAAPQAEAAAIDRVADMLAEAERPLILLGKGAAWADASEALGRLVDRGIPYVCSPMSRGTLPDDHANFVNSARSAALKGADAIVMIGGRFNWIFSFGSATRFAPGVRIAQIDIEPEELYSGADLEIGIVADAAAAADQLDRALEGRTLNAGSGGWLEELRAARDQNESGLIPLLESDAVPINPHRIMKELKDVLPRNATITVDGETTMGLARQLLPSFEPRKRFNAGTTGCMGTGVPYAIGAKLARPDEPAVAVVGDYAFGSAMMDIETAARVGANVVFVVCNNEGIAGHMLQDNFFPESEQMVASLLPASYEKLAEMVDGHAERVDAPDGIRPALERALAAGKPAVVHIRMDPKATRMSGGVYLR